MYIYIYIYACILYISISLSLYIYTYILLVSVNKTLLWIRRQGGKISLQGTKSGAGLHFLLLDCKGLHKRSGFFTDTGSSNNDNNDNNKQQ